VELKKRTKKHGGEKSLDKKTKNLSNPDPCKRGRKERKKEKKKGKKVRGEITPKWGKKEERLSGKKQKYKTTNYKSR